MDNTSIPRQYPAGELELHLRQIRLVTILPGRYVDAIACELSVVYLENLPDYYALSYTWGSRTDLRQILLNGSSFNVTRNLEASLRRLRHPTEPRIFWIDMLCIDQDSVEERSHQVNLMQLIYARAREVFLWLGDYAETTIPKAFSCLQSKEDQDYLSHIDAVRALSYIERLSSNQHLGFSEEGETTPHLAAELRALDRLMNLSWWDRIWTVQEAILPHKATIIVGWLQSSWDTLAAAAHTFFRHHALGCCVVTEFGPILHGFYTKVDAIHFYRTAYHQGQRVNLIELFRDFRNRLSTDPRDKIFGLLGLVARDPRYHALRADYTMSSETLYKEAFLHLLRNEGTLNLLVRQDEVGRTLDLPTWIPDWTAKVDQLEQDVHQYFISSLRTYNTSLSTQPVIRWSNLVTTLGVKGLLFDEVATIAESHLDNKWPDSKEIEAYLEYLETLLNIKRGQSQSYVGGGTLQHALWRLITTDKILVRSNDLVRGNPRRAVLEDYRSYLNKYPPYGFSREEFNDMRIFRVFISRLGYIGLGPRNMRIGDTVHILLGGNIPFMLRRVTQETDIAVQGTRYEFVGGCYVQGIMDGEALSGVDLSKLDWVNLD